MFALISCMTIRIADTFLPIKTTPMLSPFVPMLMERGQGSPEEQDAAWNFIEQARKPGNLPVEDRARLSKLVTPIIRLETCARPVW